MLWAIVNNDSDQTATKTSSPTNVATDRRHGIVYIWSRYLGVWHQLGYFMKCPLRRLFSTGCHRLYPASPRRSCPICPWRTWSASDCESQVDDRTLMHECCHMVVSRRMTIKHGMYVTVIHRQVDVNINPTMMSGQRRASTGVGVTRSIEELFMVRLGCLFSLWSPFSCDNILLLWAVKEYH